MRAPKEYVVRCGEALFLGIEAAPRAACIERTRRFQSEAEAEAAAEALRRRGSSTFILPWAVVPVSGREEIRP